MKKSRILIVEDDPFIAMSLSMLLKKHNYEVLGIKDTAEEALELCLQLKPDLVLLDIELNGDKKGTWLGEQLKAQQADTLIIYLTAFNDEKTIESILKTSPELYITKPFNKKVLVSNIEIALQKKRPVSETIEVMDGRKKVRLSVEDIYYVQSEGNYLNISLNDQPQVVIRGKMTEFEDLVHNKGFLRVHLRYMVNTCHIKEVCKEHLKVAEDKIPVSKTYRQEIKKWFNV